MDTVQVVVTVSVAVVGWAATHLFAIRLALKTERRKSRVEFLIKTYKRITELRVFAAGQDPEGIARFLCDIVRITAGRPQLPRGAKRAIEL